MTNTVLRMITSVGLILFSSASFSEDERTWLCISDQSTGFFYENERWEQAHFRKEKYLFRLTGRTLTWKPYETKRWGRCHYDAGSLPPSHAYWFLEGDPLTEASVDITEMPWECGGIGAGTIKFQIKSARFLYVYSGGYILAEEGKENDDTPALIIGTCSEF